ncbi:MAG: histidine--tRNA ligase [Planctomycetia bacterium]|nr:histidine--tRNA ligase [Planctomycetia bacterium]
MLIEPRTLAGFRDYLPALMIPRERFMETARQVYRSYGFVPIDTPALEYTEILLGKGGEETDKQLYRFKDNGDRDVGLRFDLTVPLARFAAQHIGTLGTPFKRYHLAPVWRGERQQRGRYREFVQCDFDTIGTTSNAADIEVALVIHDLLAALGFSRFRIHINNRMILNGLLEELQLADRTAPLLRSLDKLAKIGRDEVATEMQAKAGVAKQQAERILALVELQGENTSILDQMQSQFGSNARCTEGIKRLRELVQVASDAGIPSERIQIDLGIARGLDYYTGTVYETLLTDLPGIGSVCSGGRYDNLASLYTKQVLPGVGASLGLDRLLAAMEELKLLPATSTAAPVLLVQFSADHLGKYQAMARKLRQAGIGVEVYPEAKKMGNQLSYAEKKGFKLALIAGPDELAKGIWQVKDLAQRSSMEVPADQLVETIQRKLVD